VGATRAEWYEQNRRNPFVEITVPDALRTLTQFCGRLVRSETDTGKISCLDRRLVAKRYGRTILQGLPPFRQQITR
jgi:ATP-dependent DNA helicase DinG